MCTSQVNMHDDLSSIYFWKFLLSVVDINYLDMISKYTAASKAVSLRVYNGAIGSYVPAGGFKDRWIDRHNLGSSS